jgi:hypothetical protein
MLVLKQVCMVVQEHVGFGNVLLARIDARHFSRGSYETRTSVRLQPALATWKLEKPQKLSLT